MTSFKAHEERNVLMYEYNPKSGIADEFIHDKEISDSLAYAKANRKNKERIDAVLQKARKRKGISHREAALLLACELEEENQEIARLAREIKEHFYGNRIVMFAPLYLSNYCVNDCVYCPYHRRNQHIVRKKLTQQEIEQEVIALQDMGHKRLAIEAGEDPLHNPLEYILESIETIYRVRHKNGAIRRVNVNIAATSVARDRAMEAGIDDVGCGVLFGLDKYAYELVGLIMHAEHLEARFGVGPHTISVPRVCPADDVNPQDLNAVPDEIFEKIVAVLRIAVPYTGMIVSTRETKEVREKVLALGVSQMSGGSRTSVGGYVREEPEEKNSAQFEVTDRRSLAEVVDWLLDTGHIPSFCTACYREGRTGDRFMQLLKAGQIANCCQPNALMTLKEYLEDYASQHTKKKGERALLEELEKIENPAVREETRKYIAGICEGKRDFRF